jgi:hypothetical protein
MSDLNERGGDHCHLSGLAWRMIKAEIEKIGRPLGDDWGDPQITAEPGNYKIDWYDNNSEDAVTLYSDGVWQFYGDEGQIEGKMLPLYDLRWRMRLVKCGVDPIIAHFCVEFFKELHHQRG